MDIEADKFDRMIEHILNRGNIPGAAIAIVERGETVYSNGCGYRDLAQNLPVTPQTIYPIASTTKAITATVIGTLVDEGILAWDAPLQRYFPRFELCNPQLGRQVTLRDLLAMRTGLPRHDWLWLGRRMTREDLANRLRHLELSAGFRERFQYNNMLVTTAGYIAEVVTGKRWEDLVQSRILEPLGMARTVFGRPEGSGTTESYHESVDRKLAPTYRLSTEVTGPSGGSLHSTVLDMAHWVCFNLNGGRVDGQQLINPATLAEIHFPQVVIGKDPVAPTPHAAYAMGWFVDTYNGRLRISHSGNLHDVKSDVCLFPEDDIGFVSFINVGTPVPARLINQYAFDLLKGFQPAETLEGVLERHEKRIAESRRRGANIRRVSGTTPSHTLDEYIGLYEHPGYGIFEIRYDEKALSFRFNEIALPLEHWHYDVWIARESGLFGYVEQHPFDRTSRILFESNTDGEVAALTIQMEPTVAPIRFIKQT